MKLIGGPTSKRQDDAAFANEIIDLSALSLRQVAATAGVPASSLTRIRTGQLGMTADVRKRLAVVPEVFVKLQIADGLSQAATSGAATLPAHEIAAYQRRADELRAEVAALKRQGRIEVLDTKLF